MVKVKVMKPCTKIHSDTPTHIHMHTYTQAHTHTHKNAYTHAPTNIHACAHTIYTDILYIHKHIQTDIYITHRQQI